MRFTSALLCLTLAAFSLVLTACGGAGAAQPGPGPDPGDINVVNHVIIMLQENRSFDDYFGQMTAYRQANSIPIVSSDGKINDLSAGTFSNRNFVTGEVIQSYHTGSLCTEDLTPDWNPTHIMMNHANPAAAGPGAPMDGFVAVAFDISRNSNGLLQDQNGRRAMGFFDSTDLPYYYFMASNFAMSDALFSPNPARTGPNRLFIHAATSQGHAHDPATPLTAKTIWQQLDSAGVSWKIYFTDKSSSGFTTFLSQFTFFDDPAVKGHVVPLDPTYFDDLSKGTLPQVAFIETGMFSGRDEHTSNINPATGTINATNVQAGANLVAGIINALMASSAWQDSVFFLGWDEGGGLFDHVPPINVPNPDGIPPQDLAPGDTPGADFTITGFRVPNIIVSPFSRKNFVSHTPMDYTAFLKFVETRFKVPSLTARDAAMPNMTEFFDFTNKPWATPPTPPKQGIDSTRCNFANQ